MTLHPKFLLLLVILLSTTTFAGESHCKKGEVTYFSCKIKNSEKVVSICGIDYRDENAWLQYRYGRLKQPELVFPTKKQDSLKKFWGESHHSYNGVSYALSFKNAGFTYTTDFIEADEDFYGVNVFAKNGSENKLSCEGKPQREFVNGIDFSSLVQELETEN